MFFWERGQNGTGNAIKTIAFNGHHMKKIEFPLRQSVKFNNNSFGIVLVSKVMERRNTYAPFSLNISAKKIYISPEITAKNPPTL